MKSMTGYGLAQGEVAGVGFSVQVNAVNRKGLEVKVVLPSAWLELEPVVVEAVKKVVIRGTIQVRVELAAIGAGGGDFDEAAAGVWLDRVGAFAVKRGVSFTPSPEALVQAALQFRSRQEAPALELARSVVVTAMDQALAAFSAMRATEGAALLTDFEARLGLIAEHIEAVAARAPGVVTAAREALLKRLRESGLALDAGDERVLKEVALFADRCDIAEELTRFRSHHAQLKKLLASEGEIGRKAEFILQEMGREVNTTGAKANDYEIARRVIELKNELERIKEQLANVE
jgi:uncharacterized protein YicC (UPF0701 family)